MSDIIESGLWIRDHYLLVEELGTGGFGSVWKARHDLLETDFAIKVINVKSMDAVDVKRVLRECKLAGQLLKLPGVVHVQDAWRKDPHLFIVMELMKCDLETWIKNQRVPFAQALQWALDLCDTLEQVHAHKPEIIHRDITPKNVLLDSKDAIKLGDFGIAHIKGSLSNPFLQPGTIDYKAPELNQGYEATPAADVYSLCAVLFKLWSYRRYYDYRKVASLPEQFLAFLKKEHKDIPDTCRNMLADAISGGLTLDVKKRVSLARIQNDLQMIQACLVDQRTQRSPRQQSVVQSRSTQKTLYPPFIFSPTEPVVYPPPGKTDLPPTERIGPPPPFEVYKDHQLEVKMLAWSPDGSHIVSADRDGKVHVWNSSTRLRVSMYPTDYGHAKKVTALAWSPDSKRIALVNEGHEVWTWDALTGENVSQCTGYIDPVKAIIWLRDELHIAIVTDLKSIQLFHAATRRSSTIYNRHAAMIKAVAWSPDGQQIASIERDGSLHVWKANRGEHLFAYGNNANGADNANSAYDVVWSRNGDYLALLCADCTVQVLNATTGSHVLTYRNHSLPVKAVSWSDDGRYIASVSDDCSVQVWNATTGDNIFVYLHHAEKVTDVAWSPDGQRIASSSRDSNGGIVQVWHAPTCENFWVYHDPTAKVTATAWSPPGEQRIASASDDGVVRVRSPFHQGTIVRHCKLPTTVTALAWSDDRATIAMGGADGSVHIWNTTAPARQQIPWFQRHTRKVIAMVWSPDKKRIASASEDGSVQVWDALSGKILSTYFCHPDKITALAWPHEKMQCVSISGNSAVRIWGSTKKGWEVRYQLHDPGVAYAICSPDGKYIACISKHTIKVYETSQGANKAPISTYSEHTSAVLAIAWSPDGRCIASASAGSVHVWNFSTGQKIASHQLHFGRVNTVGWSTDSQYIISAGDDGTVKVWVWQIN
jgi:WD40 repeat protein